MDLNLSVTSPLKPSIRIMSAGDIRANKMSKEGSSSVLFSCIIAQRFLDETTTSDAPAADTCKGPFLLCRDQMNGAHV